MIDKQSDDGISAELCEGKDSNRPRAPDIFWHMCRSDTVSLLQSSLPNKSDRGELWLWICVTLVSLTTPGTIGALALGGCHIQLGI